MSAGDAGTDPARGLPGSITTVHRYDLPLAAAGGVEPDQRCLPVPQMVAVATRVRRRAHWRRARSGGVRCSHRSPIAVRFRVAIEHIEAPAVVRAKVSGDVVRRRHPLAPGGKRRMLGHAGEFAGPGHHGPPARLPFRRPHRPFRTRLGPRFGGPPVHRPRRRAARGRLDSFSVKFSVRQILASAAGAVIAAVIASSFGVNGDHRRSGHRFDRGHHGHGFGVTVDRAWSQGRASRWWSGRRRARRCCAGWEAPG